MAIAPLPAQGDPSWYDWAADIDAAARTAGTDASKLTSGTLPPARVADGSITAAKVAADVATTAAVTAASTADRNRANHTGTQSADTLTDGTTNKAYTATEKTKLAGIATGATANSNDSTLLNRANHTGTQSASTITGLAPIATSGSYADLTGKPTISASGTTLTRTTLMLGVSGLSNPSLADFTSFNTKIAPRSADMLLFMQALGTEPVWYSAYQTWATQLGATIYSTMSPSGTLSSIASGAYDAYLATQAATVAAYGKPVIIRLAHEFNLTGNGYGNTHETAAQFTAAWQYIVGKFRAGGASNALFFWCPNVWGLGGSAIDPTAGGWYPGDSYVDIVGLDGYSYDATPLTPTQLFSANYTALTTMTAKPFMVGEFGTGQTGAIAVGTKAQWYDAFFDLVRDTMPRCIGATQWERTDSSGSDFTISTSGTNTAAQAAFVKRVNAAPFIPAPGVAPNSRNLSQSTKGLQGVIDAVAEFGLSTAGSAAANSAALTAAFAAADTAKAEVFIPGGTYNLNPGLSWASYNVRLRGVGSQQTILNFATNTSNGLTVGTGDDPNLQGQQGWIKNLAIYSAPGRPTTLGDGHAGLVLNSLRFARLEDVEVRGFDVGYDMVNNSFGVDFHDCTALWSGNNLGLRLRSSTQNGNDHNFWNCWITGNSAAVYVEPDSASGADGFHFYGGQLSGGIGQTVDDDSLGVITIGRTWETGAAIASTAQTRITLTGTTFEGMHRMWCLRGYCPTDIALTNVGLNAFGGTDMALGLYKNTGGWHDRLSLRNTRFGYANFRTAVFGSVPVGTPAEPGWYEEGTIGNVTINNGTTYDLYARSALDTFGISRGVSIHGGTNATVMLDGLRLRNNGGALERSTDGTAWANLVATVTASVKTANYTLALGDTGAAIEANSASAITFTVPPNSAVAYPIGTVVEMYQASAGQLTVAAGAGVTLRTATGTLTARAQYSTISIRKRATDEWVVSGDLT